MSSHRYLLDTNIISALLRQPRGILNKRIAQRGETTLCTSIVVACELRFGLAKSGSARLARLLEPILESLDVLPLESPVEKHYAEIRNYLEQAGTPIGPNDLLIAAHARSMSLTVVTGNISEFSRVPELTVENWLQS